MSEDDSEPLTRDIAPFGVRMPPALKDRIKQAADANNRSMNAEIVSVLSEHFPTERTADLIVDTINHYLKRIAAETDEGRRERIATLMRFSVKELRKLAAISPLDDIDTYLKSPKANRGAVFGEDIDPPPPAPKLGKNEPPF